MSKTYEMGVNDRSGFAGSAGQTIKAVESFTIQNKVEGLHIRIKILSESVSLLTDRLHPVIRPIAEKESGSPPSTPSGDSPLAAQLQDIEAVLANINRHVDRLRSNLDLS